ncbi:60S ribosomal protein L23a-1 [Tanacetum coccineum]
MKLDPTTNKSLMLSLKMSNYRFIELAMFFTTTWATLFYVYAFVRCIPDGAKNAYVKLSPDYDNLDVAYKIGITRERNFCRAA